MFSVDQAAVFASLRQLMREVFEGTPEGAGGTWFVQGDEALDVTLDSISAHQASRKPGRRVSTIAAHVVHTAYYLELANDGFRGVAHDADWSGSWARQEVDEEEWTAAVSRLREEASKFDAFFSGSKPLGDPHDLTYAIANVCHAAYHLGAIRQLFLLVQDED